MCQASVESLQYGSIDHFGFTIRLRMSHRGKPMVDLEFGAELFNFFIVELTSVVGDESPGQAKPTYDILSDKVFGFVLGYLGCGPSLHPFSEVVNYHK